jgi:hypothetical protein
MEVTYMATPYEKVYGRFLNRTTDFNLAEMDDHTLNEMLKGWLHSAIVNTRTSSDLSKRDDDTEEFSSDLSDQDIELLAMGMTMAWIDQYLHSTENVLQFIGGKEEKYYSQANHIAELRAMREDVRLEMKRLHSYSTYKTNSYLAD